MIQVDFSILASNDSAKSKTFDLYEIKVKNYRTYYRETEIRSPVGRIAKIFAEFLSELLVRDVYFNALKKILYQVLWFRKMFEQG